MEGKKEEEYKSGNEAEQRTRNSIHQEKAAQKDTYDLQASVERLHGIYPAWEG